jgi:glycerophosphoryl diester phosphodiesterase
VPPPYDAAVPRRDPARPLVLAHRGASRRHRENTLEAFTAARAEGADGVELDVHRSADGALVVHHDAAVEGFGVLAEHPLVRIRAELPHVPTLPEVLDACTGLLVNIEIKNLPADADFDADESVAGLVVALLHDRGGADDALVSSFHLPTIDRVKALDPSVRTAYLTVLEPPPIAAADVAETRGHDAIHPFFGVLTEDTAVDIVLHAHALGIDVNTWTVNGPDDFTRLAAAGVDGIITDTPADALAALEAGAS